MTMTGTSEDKAEATADGSDPPGSQEQVDVDAYLDRIGLTRASVETETLETLALLQRAHVLAVPFENLSIVGDPAGLIEPGRIELSVGALYEKIVERERGGYCFELNGLFNWLLEELGFDVDRIAARVTHEGTARPPANHHTNVVTLDRRYVVDVGVGAPMMRRPIPLDGSPQTDDVGVTWRVAESDRPDATYCTQHRPADGGEWSTRYVFDDVPRELRYFEATNDFLQSAPESPFTSDPFVVTATDEGYRKLSGDTRTEQLGGTEQEQTVGDAAWETTLRREFGSAISD